LPVDPVGATGAAVSGGTLGQLVGVLGQYDQNGQLLAGNAPVAASLVPQSLDPNSVMANGMLANGK
jgi:hypothetical protein